MKEFWGFLNNLIDKFDIKRLSMAVASVLALMLVPKIDYLRWLMPLNDSTKWIYFIFSILVAYWSIAIISNLYKMISRNYKYRPKRFYRTVTKYSDCIGLYYSKEIGEYTALSINLGRYYISEDVIAKLVENNIIERSNYSYPEYRLTKRARKKLTRINKLVMFVDGKIIGKKSKEKSKYR